MKYYSTFLIMAFLLLFGFNAQAQDGAETSDDTATVEVETNDSGNDSDSDDSDEDVADDNSDDSDDDERVRVRERVRTPGARMEYRSDVRSDRMESREEIKTEMEEKRIELRTNATEKREETRLKMEEKRGEFIEKTEERLEDRAESILKRLSNVLVNLTKNADRIESRIEKMKDAGMSVGAAENYLTTATVNITEAQKLIDDAVLLKNDTEDASETEENPGQLIKARIEGFKTFSRQVVALIKEAHKNLSLAVQELKNNIPVETEVENTASTSEAVAE